VSSVFSLARRTRHVFSSRANWSF